MPKSPPKSTSGNEGGSKESPEKTKKKRILTLYTPSGSIAQRIKLDSSHVTYKDISKLIKIPGSFRELMKKHNRFNPIAVIFERSDEKKIKCMADELFVNFKVVYSRSGPLYRQEDAILPKHSLFIGEELIDESEIIDIHRQHTLVFNVNHYFTEKSTNIQSIPKTITHLRYVPVHNSVYHIPSNIRVFSVFDAEDCSNIFHFQEGIKKIVLQSIGQLESDLPETVESLAVLRRTERYFTKRFINQSDPYKLKKFPSKLKELYLPRGLSQSFPKLPDTLESLILNCILGRVPPERICQDPRTTQSPLPKLPKSLKLLTLGKGYSHKLSLNEELETLHMDDMENYSHDITLPSNLRNLSLPERFKGCTHVTYPPPPPRYCYKFQTKNLILPDSLKFLRVTKNDRQREKYLSDEEIEHLKSKGLVVGFF